jgi:branched-chain amino acid transport system permease protein
MAASETTIRISAGADGDRRTRQIHLALFGVTLALVIVLPFGIYPIFLMKVMCFALFALSFNLLFGYAGLMSFGHAAFFGLASYVASYTAKHYIAQPEIAVLAGTASAVLLGIPIGALAIRRQGIYFAMITLAFSQMVYFFALRTPKFTGGEDGLQGVPRGNLFGMVDLSSEPVLYVFVSVVFFAGFFLVYRIIYSPFGHVLKAIKENEPRAISLGYRVNRYKFLAFVLSAAIAGMAGSTKAIVFEMSSLYDIHWSMSGEPVLMSLVGGLGTVFGPVVGAALIIAMETMLTSWGSWVTVIQGVIFVLIVLLFRGGILGYAARKLRTPL